MRLHACRKETNDQDPDSEVLPEIAEPGDLEYDSGRDNVNPTAHGEVHTRNSDGIAAQLNQSQPHREKSRSGALARALSGILFMFRRYPPYGTPA